MTPEPPPRYRYLTFNTPLSSATADELCAALVRRQPGTIVDIGCGWAELLLRALAAVPTARGIGIDRDEELLERARTGAVGRGLADRLTTRTELPAGGEQADAVVCIGADHIFGTQANALLALHGHVAPRGRLLFGSGYWQAVPTPEQAATIGADPEDFGSLADLVQLALAAGFRLIDLRTATPREWETFELGYLADWEEWLVDWSDHPSAADVRARADAHRSGYLRGWREVMGFAYLVLGRP